MNSFRSKSIIMLVIFLVIAPSTLASDISTVKSEPTEDVKEIIHHKGDLIVEGGETYVIENVTFFISGNIIVKDEAQLIVKNSCILVNTSYKNEYWVYVYDNALFKAENSLLKEPFLQELMLEVEGRLILENTTSYWRVGSERGSSITVNNSYLRALYWTSMSKVNLIRSRLWFICIRLGNSHNKEMEISGLYENRNRSCLYFNSKEDFLKLEDTFVKQWHFELSSEYDKHLVIKNSEVAGFWAEFPNEVNISDITSYYPYYYKEWNIHNNVHGSIPWNLTLINTTITDKWKLIFFDKAYVKNSEAQFNLFGKSVVIARNCTVMFLDARASIYAKFIDTLFVQDVNFLYMPQLISTFMPEETAGRFVVEFENSVITAPIFMAARKCIVKGNITFSIPLSEVHFCSGTWVREYPLILMDEDGNLVPNASASLVDLEGNLVWSGATNRNGFALFNITFTKANYTRELVLKTKIQNKSFSKKIDFITDTPIIISFHQIKEEAENRLVYVESLIPWMRNLGKIKNMDAAGDVLVMAKNEYNKGDFCKALELLKKVVELIGLNIDGNPNDWDEILPLSTDEKGDNLFENGDLKSIYAVMNNRYLYIMVEIYDEEIEKAKPPLIEIDTNLDEERDYKLSIDKVENIQTHESHSIESAIDKVIEYRVPLENIDYPIEFNIGAHITYQVSENRWVASDAIEPRWTLISRKSSISLDTSSDQILLGENLTVSGEISPSKIGVPITLTYQMPNGSLLTKNVSSTDIGTFNDTFRPDVVGSWSVKASWEGDSTHNGASSQTMSFTVVETEPKPAKFEVSDLVISPEEVQEGEEVRISVRVANVGEESYGHTVDLKVDGETVDLEDVTLVGGDSMTVTFTIVEDVGDHIVEVGNLYGSFKVIHKPSFWDKIPRFPYELIIIGLAIGALILWILKHKF